MENLDWSNLCLEQLEGKTQLDGKKSWTRWKESWTRWKESWTRWKESWTRWKESWTRWKESWTTWKESLDLLEGKAKLVMLDTVATVGKDITPAGNDYI